MGKIPNCNVALIQCKHLKSVIHLRFARKDWGFVVVLGKVLKAAVALALAACTPVGFVAQVDSVSECTIARLARMPNTPMTMLDSLRAPPISDDEARTAGNCVEGARRAAFLKAEHISAREHANWAPMTTRPYRSEHSLQSVYVQVFANAEAAGYAKFEDGTPMPVGAGIAKAAFRISHEGRVSPGPLYMLEKMALGFDSDGGDWRYTLVGPDGRIVGQTGARADAWMGHCKVCHVAAREQDFLLFPAPPYRRKAN